MPNNKYKKKDDRLFELNQLSSSYSLGEYLENARIKKGLSASFVSLSTDISLDDLSKIENSKIPILKDDLKLLIDLYGLPKKLINLADDFRPIHAKRITELRMSTNRTQYEVSSLLNIAQTTYASYETGKREPDIKTLIKIANLYKTSLDYLVGRTI